MDAPFRATRSCPHRLCKPLHIGMLVVGTVIMAQVLFHGWATIVFAAAANIICLGAMRLVAGMSLMEQVAQEARDAALDVHLVVRPSWAAFAAGMDAMFVLLGGGAAVSVFTQPTASLVPPPGAEMFAVIGLGVGLQVLSQVAHRQATRPARRRRAPAPALGSSS